MFAVLEDMHPVHCIFRCHDDEECTLLLVVLWHFLYLLIKVSLLLSFKNNQVLSDHTVYVPDLLSAQFWFEVINCTSVNFNDIVIHSMHTFWHPILIKRKIKKIPKGRRPIDHNTNKVFKIHTISVLPCDICASSTVEINLRKKI